MAVPFILPTVHRSSVGSFVEKDFLLEFYFKFISILHRVNKGTYKVRNEIETKRNEINENKTKYDARLLPTHVSVSFTRRGQDLITIEQEYYAFIQRESVLFT